MKPGRRIGQRTAGSFAANVAAGWAAPAPEWVATLARACDARGLAAVARDVGYSAAALSQAMMGTYKGRLAAVEQAVRAALMDEEVTCPELGPITLTACRDHQAHARAGNRGSAIRARMCLACRACGHYQKGATK